MVAALAASGATPTEFAQRHGLEVQRVQRWWAKLAGAGGGAPAYVSTAAAQVTFAPLRLIESAPCAKEAEGGGARAAKTPTWEVVVGRVVVRVPSGFDPSELASVIAALEEGAC